MGVQALLNLIARRELLGVAAFIGVGAAIMALALARESPVSSILGPGSSIEVFQWSARICHCCRLQQPSGWQMRAANAQHKLSLSSPKVVRDRSRRRVPFPLSVVLTLVGAHEYMSFQEP